MKNSRPSYQNFLCFFPDFKDERQLPETEKLLEELIDKYDAKPKKLLNTQLDQLDKIRASVVHFATHTTGNENEKSLVFEKGNTLSVNGNLGKFKADLVVLNACETQKGAYIIAEGYYNLPKLFLSNGCGAVISSLWNVDEAASADFFKKFYAYLSEGTDKEEAIHLVENDFLAHPKFPDWSNPFYWSAYILTGNNKAINL